MSIHPETDHSSIILSSGSESNSSLEQLQAQALRQRIDELDAEAASRRTARKSLTPWPVNVDMVHLAYNARNEVVFKEGKNQPVTLEELQNVVTLFEQMLDVPKTEAV